MNEMTEEIETITLQPIGKGVQDLAPGIATISRPGSRAATPRGLLLDIYMINYE